MADAPVTRIELVTEDFEVVDGLVPLHLGDRTLVVMTPLRGLKMGRRCLQAALEAFAEERR